MKRAAGSYFAGMFMPSILLFEDEPVISWNLQLDLEQLGFTILLTWGLSEALAIFQQYQPDLAIINFRQEQPGDGMRLARLLHTRFSIPVLIITGARPQDLALSPDFQAEQAVLYKPFSRIQLVKTLTQLFGAIPSAS